MFRITPSQKQENTPSQKPSARQSVEALLFYLAQDVSFKELSEMSNYRVSEVKEAVIQLEQEYIKRGIRIAYDKKKVSLVSAPEVAELIQSLQKSEEEKPLSKSALETLSIVSYNGPVSRPEIDYIRGVNSTYALRNLAIRGLIEKIQDGSSITYMPTLDTFKFMGITKQEELPDFQLIQSKTEAILKKKDDEEQSEINDTHTT